MTTAHNVFACQCSPISPCDLYGDTGGIIFVGKAVNIEKQDYVVEHDGRKFTFTKGKVFLQVKEPFRGVESGSVVITTFDNRYSCSPSFEQDTSYLIYGNGDPKKEITVGLCGNIPVSSASAHLAFLRNLPKVASGVRLYGKITAKVRLTNGRQLLPEPILPRGLGLRIQSLNHSNLTYEAIPDCHGNFEINGVVAGKYKVSPITPESFTVGLGNLNFYQQDYVEIDVADKGCIDLSASFENNSQIKGTILDKDGKPVEGATVELLLANTKGLKYQEQHLVTSKSTQPDGSFVFRRVPVGTYNLGVNVISPPNTKSPYPATFWTYKENPDAPAEFDIKIGETKEKIEILLPTQLEKRVVQVDVIMSDGSPASNSSVSLIGIEYLPYCTDTCGIKTNDKGRASIQGYEGKRYVVQASQSIKLESGSTLWFARPVEFLLTKSTPTLKLTIDPKFDPHKTENKIVAIP